MSRTQRVIGTRQKPSPLDPRVLCVQLLQFNHYERCSASEALSDPWFRGGGATGAAPVAEASRALQDSLDSVMDTRALVNMRESLSEAELYSALEKSNAYGDENFSAERQTMAWWEERAVRAHSLSTNACPLAGVVAGARGACLLTGLVAGARGACPLANGLLPRLACAVVWHWDAACGKLSLRNSHRRWLARAAACLSVLSDARVHKVCLSVLSARGQKVCLC